MFSSRGPSGAKIIGRPRTRTRIPLCPVPSLEPKLLASVGKLGFRNGERQQRPDSNSVETPAGPDGGRHILRRGNRVSSKFRRKLCDEDDNARVAAESTLNQQNSKHASSLLANQFSFMPLLASTDPAYRMTLTPRSKFALRASKSLAGYCFCCHRHCTNLPRHLESDPTHKKFNATASNFAELDHFLDAELYANRRFHRPESKLDAKYPLQNLSTPAAKHVLKTNPHREKNGGVVEVTVAGPEHGVSCDISTKRHSVKTPGTISTKRMSKLKDNSRVKAKGASVLVGTGRHNGQESNIGTSKKRRRDSDEESSACESKSCSASSSSSAKARKLSRPSLPVTVRSSRRRTKPVEHFNPSLPNQYAFFQGEYARKPSQPSSKASASSSLPLPTPGKSSIRSPPYLAHVTALGGKFVPWSTMIQRLPTRTYFMAVSSKTMVTTVFTLSWKDP